SPADRELLQRFAQRHDEAAFSELVYRHETLVMDTCRRVLASVQDAEDAFQATFLWLAQKAGSLGKYESVAGWLFVVAHRLATKAKATAARRCRHEGQAAKPEILEASDDVTWKEMKAIVNEELAGLPERYRAPLLLCYLEGKARDETARQLGWTLGA